ncbi:hypothetical protein BH11ACT2_BH11ACT2_17150 [soil metagenome]
MNDEATFPRSSDASRRRLADRFRRRAPSTFAFILSAAALVLSLLPVFSWELTLGLDIVALGVSLIMLLRARKPQNSGETVATSAIMVAAVAFLPAIVSAISHLMK